MKNTSIILMLILSACTANAQTVPPLDPSKVISTTHASSIFQTPCSGWANPQSIDLKWKPILTKKIVESENESPNQKYVDSVKAYKLKLKEEYELKHSNNRSGERTTTVAPIVGTNFSGYTPSGNQPLDNCVAISNGGIIVSVENTIMAYYNTSGTLLGETSFYNLLSSYYTLYNVCDPVILYDPNYDRFIFFCQELNSSGLFANNRIFVCFSKTNNPSTGGWYYYEWTGDPTGSGGAFDYPKMAINDSELFITGNIYSEPSGNYNQSVIFQLNKLAGYTGSSVGGVHWDNISGSPFTILPVSWGQNADITTGMVLVSTQSGGGSTINYYDIRGNWANSPTISYASIPTTPYTLAANAFQQGTATKLNTDNCRALGGFYLNYIIHFVFHSDYGSGYTGINYNRLDLTTLTNTSSLVGSLGLDFAYPSVASYATTITDKSVMIGFGLSGSTTYPQIDVVNCDDTMTWSVYATVYNSPNYIQYAVGDTLDRWGDYTGMSRYNSSSTPVVWMSGSRANTSHNWQTWIAEIYGNTTATCTIPAGLSVTSITTTSAVLNWVAASGAASYNIQYRVVGTTTWSTTTSTTTSVTITGLTPATNYQFEVQTVCTGSGVSSWSALGTFTTLSPPCAIPTGLSAISITATTALLTWNGVSGANSYNIQYMPVGGSAWSNTTSNTNSVNIAALTPNTTYEFEVQTVCSSNNSSWSAVYTFTTLTNNLGITSTQNATTTKVFPNPITNTFSVEFSLTETVSLDISVIDINGKVVKDLYSGIGTAGDNIFSFDKSNLAGGVYFLVIKANSQTLKNEKIIVVN